MSFSSDIKSRLLDNISINEKSCCRRAETFGEYITINRLKTPLERDYTDFLELIDIPECCIKSIVIR